MVEILKVATPDAVEFVPLEIPDRLYPSGYDKNESWIDLHFGNLVQSFVDEIIMDVEPEGAFLAGAKSQEIQEAVYLSHLKKQWIPLPLE